MSRADSNQLSDSAWLRCEAVIDRFEKAWQGVGEPKIADFLPPPGTGGRTALLHELIKVDVEYRWSKGIRTRIEDYASEFPELGDQLPVDLLLEEVRVRQYHGDVPTSRELHQRFPDSHFAWSQFLASHAPPSETVESEQHPTLRINGELAANADILPSLKPTRPGQSGIEAGASSGLTWLGKYELREQIGRGGFATVYRAYDAELRREVAIKVPRSDLMDDPGTSERMIREAQSAARLRHPAIIPIYEVGRGVGN
jgi:hypothetical protein